MTSRFRHVLFIADPFAGLQFPLGALVEHRGQVTFVASPVLPCAKCVGGPAARLARYLVESLASATSFDRHPGHSAQESLGCINELPEEITDPVLWVRSFALPQKPEAKS